MGSVEKIAPYLEPVRKTVTVKKTPAEAFEIFTAKLASWWPLSQFSIYQAEAVTCAFEPRSGGDVYETSRSGERSVWGRILAWEPPDRFVMTWHPGRDADTAQEVEVRFAAVAGGTRVELTHRGWEKLGAEAAPTRESYDSGWETVFGERFATACA